MLIRLAIAASATYTKTLSASNDQKTKLEEEIYISKGKGVIHLKGGPSDTFLYVKKNPRIACFHAEIGTVWRYQVGNEIHENIIGENYQYEKLVKTGNINQDETLSSQFSHILELLTNGLYKLKLCEYSGDTRLLPAIEKGNLNSEYDVYGGMAEVAASQTFLDETIVSEYKEQIQKGERPIAVLIKIENSWVIYVIDGHHKFAAYNQLNVNPKVLLISKLDAKDIQLEEGISTLKKLGLKNEKWMKEYQNEKVNKLQEVSFISDYSKGLKTYFK